MWPSDGVRGHREWSRRCRFNDPNCGGSPLRHEEEREGSIVLDLCMKLVEMIFWTPISNGFLLATGGHSATKTAKRQCLAFSSWAFYSIRGGRFPFLLAIPLSGQLLWGSHGNPHNDF